MEITEVRIKLPDETNETHLLAYASICFDDQFVVHEVKVVNGRRPFVCMPSRRLMDRCRGCGWKNHLRAKFCNECGVKLDCNRAIPGADGRIQLFTDVAHPINSSGRDLIEGTVMEAYEEEKKFRKADDRPENPWGFQL